MLVQNAIIDGEVVCLDAQGVSRFNELMSRRGKPISMLSTCCGSTVKICGACHSSIASIGCTN
jgi:hypothetical protein